ncbi:MAG: hypothetical protein WDN06_15020 [Asticcacaulis sp.]
MPAFLFGSSLYLAWRAGAVTNPKVASLGAGIASLTVILASSYAGSDVLIVIALGLLVLSLAGMGREKGRGGTNRGAQGSASCRARSWSISARSVSPPT